MTQQCTIEKIKEVLSDLQFQLDEIIQSQKNTVVDNNKQPIEKAVEDKRPSSSWWDRVKESVRKGFKVKKETVTQASDSGGSRKGRRSGHDQENADLEILKLQNDIRQMKSAFENLTHFQSNINKSLETEVPSSKLKAILWKTDSAKSRARDLKEIRRKVLSLKGQIPSLLKKESSIGLKITYSQTAEETGQIIETGSDISLPGLHVSDDFKESPAFEEVKEKFEELAFIEKLCLLSFAVFPENKEVQRTMLMYWWIGEGFITHEDSENTVTSILNEFSTKRLLEPVEDERKLEPSGYKMDPHVHSAVIRLASYMELYVLHGKEGKLVMTKSEKGNVCLVRGSSLQPEAKNVHLIRSTSLQQEAKTSGTKQIALKSVFNSSERYPDFTFKWFPKMGSLKVLYLGRWERTAMRHIEVESTEFLKDIKSLRSLRLASFQGISRIENLKDLSCTLPQLVILDLRACYNLEALPDDIGSLKSLIYLDVSECYMLDRMPKEIADLKQLQVLKGFVIAQSDDEKNCTVKHLGNLHNLRKLSITVNRYDFKVEDFMESMKGLQRLESLKIAWGAPFPVKETTNEEKQGGDATEEKHTHPKEGEDDLVHKKGQTSEEKSEDGNDKANLEEGKKSDEVKAESLNSDKVVEEEKKTSPSRESTETIKEKPDDGVKGKADQEEGKKRDEVKAESLESEKEASPSGGETGTIQNKPDDEGGKRKVAGDGDKGKAAEEGNKQDTVDAEKSENGVEGVKKASPSSEITNTIENKQKDDKQEEKRDGEKDKTEEGKKKDEVNAENSKPDKVLEGDKKASPPQESQDTVKSKADDDQRGDKQEEKRDGEKDKTEEGKKKDEVNAENSKPDKVLEGDKKTSPPQESQDTVKSKPDDDQRGDKQEEKRDEEKDKTEEGKKKDEVKAENSKPDKVLEGDKKTSSPQESQDTVKSKPDDDQKGDKQEEKRDGEKDKTEEGKKKDEVKAENSKPDKVLEEDKKTSPPQESQDTVKSKPDDDQRGDKQEEKRDGEKDKTEEGKKKNEVKAENSKPDKVLEGDKKTSPPQESQDTVKSKPDDDQKGGKQEEKRDGEKDKTEEGKEKDEVNEEKSKPDKVLEGDKKTSPPQESKDTVKSKPDDHQRGDKQEDKRDGEKDKTEEEKKKDEVKAESSKPDKVIEGDKNKSLAQQFNDTIQSKPDDHKENSKVQEKEDGQDIKAASKQPDGGEAKTQKLDKEKLGKKVSFSEETLQKKPDDAMEKENHETASTSRSIITATKESRSRLAKMFTRNETKKPGKGGKEDSGIDTSGSKLYSRLKKLELECYPKKEPPSWLNPKTLDNLIKLSIKGGSLSRFSDEPLTAENKCAVKILRLKYLHEFKAEWKDLQALFPKLELLEKYKCPRVALCPTDGNGVWRSKP